MITVMITGVGGGGFGRQIFKAIKLADTPYKIVGTDITKFSMGLELVDYPYIVPPSNDPEYINALLEICEKHKVQALFNGSEPELRIVSKHRQRFYDAGIFLPINTPEVIDLCMDKARTMDFLKNHGFHTSEYSKVESMDELIKFKAFPAVLKPSVGGGGSNNIFLAQTKDELLAFGSYLFSIYPQFMVQEYVGTPEDEYTVGVLHDMQGTILNSIAVKRYIISNLSRNLKIPNRTDNKKLGPHLVVSSGYSQGEIGTFPNVCKVCEEISQIIGAKGALNIQCRYVNQKVYVFEINPRFSGTTSLRAMVGFNEPDILIRTHLLGEEVEPFFKYDSGIIMRGVEEYLIKGADFNVVRGQL